MIYPSYKAERRLCCRGYVRIAGVDEVGRGAWAGPIVAAAAIISDFSITNNQLKSKLPIFKMFRDSKLLSAKQREEIFEGLKNEVNWSVGSVSHREIDCLGIGRANVLVIQRAINKLSVAPDYLLLDKVFGFESKTPFATIIKGDQKVFSIALASIFAKVYRDRLMKKYHQKFPDYFFDKHKGYGTGQHQQCLNQFGPCPIHRQSYRPIKILSSKF